MAFLDSTLQVVDEILQANRSSASLENHRQSAQTEDNKWRLEDGLLLYENRLHVPNDDSELRTRLLDNVHCQVSTAHPGVTKTAQMIQSRYYWPGWRHDVARYVRNCARCRRAENPRDRNPGFLHPLPLPSRPWQHISMDFHSFPRDKVGRDAALVVVDRLSKRPISIPCSKAVGSRDTTKLFVEYVYRYYGPPDTIVSDRGPQFVAAFWDEFCTVLGIHLKLSTAKHPQTDGQTEIVNQHINMRLRPFVNYYQDNWSDLLPLMDFAAAALPSETTQLSPFMVTCGYEPRTSFDWRPLASDLPADERTSRQQCHGAEADVSEQWNSRGIEQ